jgi:hypothetical protein
MPANEKAQHAIVRGPVLLLFGGAGRGPVFFLLGSWGSQKGIFLPFSLFPCSHMVAQGVPNSTSVLSHWLHELSISKTVGHHIWPGLIPPL